MGYILWQRMEVCSYSVLLIVYKRCSWYEMSCSSLVLDSLTGWVMWPCCVIKSWIIIKILRCCLVLRLQLALVPGLHLQLFLEPVPSDHPGNKAATSHPLPTQGAVVHLHWMISDHYLMVVDDTVFEHTWKNVVGSTTTESCKLFSYRYIYLFWLFEVWYELDLKL